MKREVSLEEISDGKLYHAGDMVKADCQDCKGCSACCRGMGTSIVLDPLDGYRLTRGLGVSFEALLADRVELNVVDGIILPNLKMVGSDEKCAFLNEAGRCEIHELRPGICRLFPLGRYYEEDQFSYFLQVHECKHENRTKVKVKKWIDTPQFHRYEAFVTEWHSFQRELQGRLENGASDELARQISLFVLQNFYLKAYDGAQDFYEQFTARMAQARLVFH